MAEPKVNELMEKIVSLCKRRGFVFQSSEIYGDINGFWDYGPLGAELKRNVKDYWWRSITQLRDDVSWNDPKTNPNGPHAKHAQTTPRKILRQRASLRLSA